MQVRILGTAAGGGFPQWNCNCKYCGAARLSPFAVPRRLHASVALSVRKGSWFIVNATPDIRLQIDNTAELLPGPGVRETPVKGIFLTDAELDHTIGLLMLREGACLQVFASSAILKALSSSFPVASVLSTYANFEWISLDCGHSAEIEEGLLRINAFFVDRKSPRYAGSSPDESGSDWVVGYRFEDTVTGGSLAVMPQLGRFDEGIMAGVADADYILVDGTFFYEDDLHRVGIAGRTAFQMGHLPLSGENGIIDGINRVNARRLLHEKARAKTFLIHINNTNPVLSADSEERKILAESAIEVVDDGLSLSV